jgi:RHS repeat-associated protein
MLGSVRPARRRPAFLSAGLAALAVVPAVMLPSAMAPAAMQAAAGTRAGTAPVTVDDQHYSYGSIGQVLSDADTPAAGPAQVQCYSYDYLGRLARAWSQGSAGRSAGPSQAAEAGAAAPYWQQYSYNAAGDMTSEVSVPASGPATTITSTYPAAGSARPHAVTSQAVTSPSGTVVTGYGYDAAGQLTSESGSVSQSLSWDAAGQLASVTAGSGATRYLHDAGGSLLIEEGPAATTLYLPDEELVLDNASGTVTGTRYYSVGGQAVAARTSAGGVYYLAGNQEGTAILAISSATLAVTRRYYTPYGSPAGPVPLSWPGDQGFQDGTADPATGLTSIGAREYDPATASFISPDPLLAPYDPQDLNPYAYATDSPPSMEDPTGQLPAFQYGTGSTCVGTAQACAGTVAGSQDSPAASQPASAAAIIAGDASYGGGTPDNPYPAQYALPVPDRAAYIAYTALSFRPDPFMTGLPIALASLAGFCSKGPCPSSVYAASVHDWWGLNAPLAAGAGMMEIAGAFKDAAAADGADGAATEGANAGADLYWLDRLACAGGDSFTPATKVLLASGAAVPISQLRPGEKVLAVNTRTGKTQAETVTAVLVHHDSDLYDLKIRDHGKTAVIGTTASHLFWDPSPHPAWIPAGHLTPGTHLKTPDGQPAVVAGGSVPAGHDGWMWDLTIQNDHDFYVVVTTTVAVLVHNCPVASGGGIPASSADVLRDPQALEGLTPSQIDDLARNAGYDILPGKAGAANPATRYYMPGTNGSVGFRVLPSGVTGQTGIKGSAYLRFFGGPFAGLRIPLASPLWT